MDDALIPVGILGILSALMLMGVPLLYATHYHEVAAGQALLVNKMERVEVFFTRAKELLIEIERRQADALSKLRADTGTVLTVEQLEDRLSARLQQMVEDEVAKRLSTTRSGQAEVEGR